MFKKQEMYYRRLRYEQSRIHLNDQQILHLGRFPWEYPSAISSSQWENSEQLVLFANPRSIPVLQQTSDVWLTQSFSMWNKLSWRTVKGDKRTNRRKMEDKGWNSRRETSAYLTNMNQEVATESYETSSKPEAIAKNNFIIYFRLKKNVGTGEFWSVQWSS